MSRNAILPDGQRVNLDLYQYSLSGDTITFLPVTGLGNMLSFTAATGMGPWIVGQFDTVTDQGAPMAIKAISFSLSSVDPAIFDIMTATVNARGAGLVSGLKLYIEDVVNNDATDMDSNGYYMTLTAIDSQNATAVFTSAGDVALGSSSSVIIYLQDANGNKIPYLNAIKGTFIVNTTVSIP